MTQKELIIEYLKEFGMITPAKIAGVIYKNIMFGSETSKRCRELRAKGILKSHCSGKFEVFELNNINNINSSNLTLKSQNLTLIEELNNKLQDILNGTIKNWSTYPQIKEINDAIKSKNIHSKKYIINKYTNIK